jgi:uncharacterized phiE125 gp8 family phage protein
MSISNVSPNWSALPAALLADAKVHLRITWESDDAFITHAIGRAIGALEQQNDVLINPTTYTWTPAQDDFSDGRARVPFTPASAFTAEDNSGDVTASYAIESNALHGAKPQYLVGAFAEGLDLSITAGFAAAADIPPRMLDRIMRLTAHLYEHREILIPGQEFRAPDLALDATDWMPRV